jgi:ubiquinone/menaquinone biosynthesis C-methylase UbiE
MTQTTGRSIPRTGPERWSKWVLERRFGNDDEASKKTDAFLWPIREHVVGLAGVRAGDVVLDIGSRDGYMGLRSLELVGDEGRVIFTEQSDELLDTCRAAARSVGLDHRAEFRRMAPDDLAEIADGSVDVVIMRSILNYVPDKLGALAQFHRVLRPGGRLGFVQMYPAPASEDEGSVLGYQVPELEHLAARVRAVFDNHKPLTYEGFDERDLLGWLRAVGFAKIDMHHEIEIAETSDWPIPVWEKASQVAAGPDQPTLQEAIDEALSPDEAAELIARLRPEVEGGRRHVWFPKTYVGAVRSLPLDREA